MNEEGVLIKSLKYYVLVFFCMLAANAMAIEGIVAPATRASFVIPGVPGEAVFQDFSGTCKFDLNDIGATVYNIDLDVQTLNAGIKSAFVKSKSFLDADGYKYLSFDSTHNVVTGKYTMKMYGDLTLRGVAKPIVWDVTIDPTSTEEEARFKATVDIDRRRWGINTLSLIISNTVKITVLGVMAPNPEEAPAEAGGAAETS